MDLWPDNTDEQRYVLFRPAFHKCDPNPSKNYGIGSVRMWFVLKVNGWAMTWDVSTDWGLPDEAFRSAAPACNHGRHQTGYPATGGGQSGAVDWHSPVPMFDDQQPSQSMCKWISGPCYTDSGYLLGDEMFDLLRIEGDEAVWSKLRELMMERAGPPISR